MRRQRHWTLWIENQLFFRPEYRIIETEKQAVKHKRPETETSGEIDSDTDAETQSQSESKSEALTERNTVVGDLVDIDISEDLVSTHDAIGEILNDQM